MRFNLEELNCHLTPDTQVIVSNAHGCLFIVQKLLATSRAQGDRTAASLTATTCTLDILFQSHLFQLRRFPLRALVVLTMLVCLE